MDRLISELTVLEVYCVFMLAVAAVFGAALGLRELQRSASKVEKAFMTLGLCLMVLFPGLWGAYLIAP